MMVLDILIDGKNYQERAEGAAKQLVGEYEGPRSRPYSSEAPARQIRRGLRRVILD